MEWRLHGLIRWKPNKFLSGFQIVSNNRVRWRIRNKQMILVIQAEIRESKNRRLPTVYGNRPNAITSGIKYLYPFITGVCHIDVSSTVNFNARRFIQRILFSGFASECSNKFTG